MGCNCGQNKVRNAGRRPVVSPRGNRAVNNGLAAGPAPIQIQALARTQELSAGGLSKERRLVERKRRAAIARRQFGK